ncbi:MAG: hypothetical protein O3C40_08055 [Planctomycetota bacterium]|nr:hypothetical protein [Planctomycetota bacterium]
MIRQFILTATAMGFLAAATTNAEARNLFNRQPDPAQEVEPLPAPPTPSQQGWYAPAQKMPFQAAQKGAYQAVQKGAYQKSAVVATCVRYVQHRTHRKVCCDCGQSYQTVLSVIDPRTCCQIDVPVCLPSCCTGPPQCSGRNGLLGRGITNYNWCCGYAVRIVVGHHGDVTVHYYGV